MTLHDCAALIVPRGHWDLFPPAWWFLWFCTHGTSTPAYSIVCRNVAEIGSVLDLPAFAGVVGTGESTASFDCAVPFLGWILLTRGLKKAKAVFRPFCIHFLKKKARFRSRISLPELLRARRFLYVEAFYYQRKWFQIGMDCRSLPLLAKREVLLSCYPAVPAAGLCIRTVRVSGRLCKALSANQTCTGRSKNTSGTYAAAVPNGRVRRSLTRQGFALPMRRWY